nr:prepilin peptidase [Gammaproteobacteria bacterium]
MLKILLIIWMCLAAGVDMRQRRVPNLLVATGLLGALLCLLLTRHTLTGASWGQGAAAMLVGLLLSVPGYRQGRMGAGDVKLLAVLGLASDLSVVLISVAGAGLAMAIWALIHPHLPSRLMSPCPAGNFRRPPYLPFLLIGFIPAIALLYI